MNGGGERVLGGGALLVERGTSWGGESGGGGWWGGDGEVVGLRVVGIGGILLAAFAAGVVAHVGADGVEEVGGVIGGGLVVEGLVDEEVFGDGGEVGGGEVGERGGVGMVVGVVGGEGEREAGEVELHALLGVDSWDKADAGKKHSHHRVGGF